MLINNLDISLKFLNFFFSKIRCHSHQFIIIIKMDNWRKYCGCFGLKGIFFWKRFTSMGKSLRSFWVFFFTMMKRERYEKIMSTMKGFPSSKESPEHQKKILCCWKHLLIFKWKCWMLIYMIYNQIFRVKLLKNCV